MRDILLFRFSSTRMPIPYMKKNKSVIVLQAITVIPKKQLLYVYKRIIKYFHR